MMLSFKSFFKFYRIRNAEPDETSCLTTKSLEITIKNQKKLILEIQKRLIQLQNALNEAEQATKETKMMLNNCREDKIAVKSTLLERELENDKLQCEKEQLNQRLQMQKEHAEEQINKLKKKLQEKEKTPSAE
ncbi:uncharacterized protein HH_0809-like [Mytilus edulis]|uniref:uncharacterized protein HH_0809-like n=1 Tax=Mytilus edulis TaxID=6550 RepID=UPI0039EF7439